MARKKKTRWSRQHYFKRKKSSKNSVGHPAYIYAKSKRDYKYLAFTHDSETDGVSNVPMKYNIDPDEKNAQIKSYMVPKFKVDKRDNFRDPDKNYRIHKDDWETVKKHKK